MKILNLTEELFLDKKNLIMIIYKRLVSCCWSVMVCPSSTLFWLFNFLFAWNGKLSLHFCLHNLPFRAGRNNKTLLIFNFELTLAGPFFCPFSIFLTMGSEIDWISKEIAKFYTNFLWYSFTLKSFAHGRYVSQDSGTGRYFLRAKDQIFITLKVWPYLFTAACRPYDTE